MRHLNRSLVLLAGLFICVSAAAIQAQTATAQNQPAGSPSVNLSITTPDGQTRQLTTHESGLVTVSSGGREYGFRPTMHDDLGTSMTITIFDMGSASEAVREIGTVDVKGGGPAVASRTSPAFKVQASKSPRQATT
jgi:hypothetical protein